MELKSVPEMLELLIRKGFYLTHYEDQGVYFYTLDIKEPAKVKALYQTLYSGNDYLDEIEFKGIEFTIEIMTNFSVSQFIFVGLDAFDSFEDQNEFYNFVEKQLDDAIVVR